MAAERRLAGALAPSPSMFQWGCNGVGCLPCESALADCLRHVAGEGVTGHFPLERVAPHEVGAGERLFPPNLMGSENKHLRPNGRIRWLSDAMRYHMKNITLETAVDQLKQLASLTVRNQMVMEKLFERLNQSESVSMDVVGSISREVDDFLANDPDTMANRFPTLFDKD